MGEPNWMVERKVHPLSKPDIRQIYIEMLEEVISELKKGESFIPLLANKSGEINYEYDIPTVIFATAERRPEIDYVHFKLFCYRDAQTLIKHLEREELGELGELGEP